MAMGQALNHKLCRDNSQKSIGKTMVDGGEPGVQGFDP